MAEAIFLPSPLGEGSGVRLALAVAEAIFLPSPLGEGSGVRLALGRGEVIASTPLTFAFVGTRPALSASLSTHIPNLNKPIGAVDGRQFAVIRTQICAI